MIAQSSNHERPQSKALVTGLGWVNASGSGRGGEEKIPQWDEGIPTVPAAILKSFKGGSRFGRLDLFSRIGVAAVGLALQDAGHLPQTGSKKGKTGTQKNYPPADIALICSTTSSCSLTDHDFYTSVIENPNLASPGLFVYTLATSFSGEAALRFSLSGTSMAIIEPRPNAVAALIIGIEELITGDEDIVVSGICNLFAQNIAAPQPSGAMFMVLEKERTPEKEKPARTYATLSCDPQDKLLYCNNKPCPDIFSLCEIICG